MDIKEQFTRTRWPLLAFICFCAFLITVSIFLCQYSSWQSELLITTEYLEKSLRQPEKQELTQEEPIVEEKESVLMFVGDMMLSRNVGKKMKEENDWQWPFLKIGDRLDETDLLFGNLEGPITDKIISRGNMIFGADPKAIEGLRYAGFDILSLANNHAGDQGRQGLEDTFTILKENSIDYVGGGSNKSEAHSPVVKEIDGTKIAFLAYTENSFTPNHYEATKTRPGIAFMNVEKMQEDVGLAKQKADLVIVSMHSGIEYASRASNSQIKFAHAAIDAGADLVVGHHSHVRQEIEKYKNHYIAYSLGNFVFDQRFSEETMQGLILEVMVAGNEIKEVKSIEVKISDSFQPQLESIEIETPEPESLEIESPPEYTSGNSRYSRGTCMSDANCYVGGCSGEVCSSEPGIITTCEVLPDFPDKSIYECGCVNGVCGWRLR